MHEAPFRKLSFLELPEEQWFQMVRLLNAKVLHLVLVARGCKKLSVLISSL